MWRELTLAQDWTPSELNWPTMIFDLLWWWSFTIKFLRTRSRQSQDHHQAGRLRCMQVSFILSGAEIKTIVPVDCKSIHSFEYLHCRFYNNVVSGTASDQVKLYGIIANLSTASITYVISGVQSAHLKYFTSKPSPDEGLRRCCAFWQRRLRCQMFTMGYPMSLSVATIFSSSL